MTRVLVGWRRTRSIIAIVSGAAVLMGCATSGGGALTSATSDFAQREVSQRVQLHTTSEQRDRALGRVKQLLAEPVNSEGAVEIALRFSAGFQRMLAESEAATAASTQSARLPNPLLDYGRLASGDIVEIDRALKISLLDFLVWPQRRRIAESQRIQHRLRSAGDVIRLTADVRRAWVEAVAANQSALYARQVTDSAKAGAELARRMAAVGNFSRLERARQQAFYADATTELARARLQASGAREALIRLLGLSRDLAAQLRLPERLPDLPAEPDSDSVVTQRAFDERLDIKLARAELDFAARSLGLTRATSIVNTLEVGATSNSVPQEGTLTGYGIEFRVPLFDFGDARRANARAVYLGALNRATQLAVNAASSVQESYQAYRTAFDIARHYRDEIVPLRKSMAEDNLLLYNGMLISVFELLADTRDQISSVRQAILAQRDFWQADAALRAALIGEPTEAIVLGPASGTSGAGTATPH